MSNENLPQGNTTPQTGGNGAPPAANHVHQRLQARAIEAMQLNWDSESAAKLAMAGLLHVETELGILSAYVRNVLNQEMGDNNASALGHMLDGIRQRAAFALHLADDLDIATRGES